jgi:D-alanyl-D-alanine carboxypeptidase (penicillin-binding protein 5/6)
MALRQRMAAIVGLLILMCIQMAPATMAQDTPPLDLTSARYIVVDAETGYVYAEYNARERVAIASVTKMFTAVQALEMASLDTVLTTSDFDLRDPDGNYMGTNGTLMGFGVGEEYTLRDLLYGMMLPSGNDAAITIARSLGYQEGDSDQEAVDRFMALLNQRVADMGLTDTNFVTPSGWGVEGHYSTAADVATFGRLAARYPVLMEIMGTQSYTTSNGLLTVTNSNRSLNEYPSIFAGKTGYDWDAGYCLINFATRDDGGTMIAVNLDGQAPGGWYNDSATLLDYGFEARGALLASGAPFDGPVAAFTDPAPAEIARSANPEVSFTISEPAADTTTVEEVAEIPDVTAETARPETDDPIPLARPALLVVAIAAIGVLALRGFVTLRGQGTRPTRQRPEGQAATPDGWSRHSESVESD